jgi:Cysteine dioxygenase type I
MPNTTLLTAMPVYSPTGRYHARPESTDQADRADQPGRALHPASHDNPEPLSFSALQAIAAGLGQVRRPVTLTERDDPDAPRSTRLLVTAAYDVWLITWPPGSRLTTHDHGEARGVLKVVEGDLEETVADTGQSGPPRTRRLRAGESSRLEGLTPHALANVSTAETTTVHAYSPPLAEFTFFDPPHVDGEEARTIPVT